MTNDEINRYIGFKIMGECFHWANEAYPPHCQYCNEPMGRPYGRMNTPVSDYCSDASPRSLLNGVVAKIKATVQYAGLQEAVFQTLLLRIYDAEFLSLTAEQIARACVEAHKAAHVDNGRNTQDTPG